MYKADTYDTNELKASCHGDVFYAEQLAHHGRAHRPQTCEIIGNIKCLRLANSLPITDGPIVHRPVKS